MWTRCNLLAFQSQCLKNFNRQRAVRCFNSWHQRIFSKEKYKFIRFRSSFSNQDWPFKASVTYQTSYLLNSSVRFSSSTLPNTAKSSISFDVGTPLNKYLSILVEHYNKTLQDITLTLDSAQSNVDGDSTRLSRTRIEELNGTLSGIEPIAVLFIQHRQHTEEIEQLKDILQSSNGTDEDLCKMAMSDIQNLHDQLSIIENEIVDLLVPPSFGDQNDIILEVSAGVGGQEAMLFTKELFEMYKRYSDFRGWTIDTVNFEVSDIGGVRHAMACISGHNVFMRMKYEGGVHRVQRVPKTEKSGRVHTSTATVAVMARPNEVDIVLNAKDLRIETCRASGKGGQHVNTTDSAVRIVHLPTGVCPSHFSFKKYFEAGSSNAVT